MISTEETRLREAGKVFDIQYIQTTKGDCIVYKSEVEQKQAQNANKVKINPMNEKEIFKTFFKVIKTIQKYVCMYVCMKV